VTCRDNGFHFLLHLSYFVLQKQIPPRTGGICFSGIRNLHHTSDIGCLVAFGPLKKIELHGLAFVQGTVTVLLDGRVVDKYILPRRTLNEAITLGSIKPFHSTSFSHNVLLSPLQ
jgi:hypothetical protein